MANTVTIQITSVNHAGPGIAAAITQVQQLTVAVHQSGNQTDRTSDSFARLRSVISSAATKVLEGAANVGKYASAALAAAQGTFLLSKAIATAFVNLAPLVALLPGLIGGLGLIQTTVKLMAPGFAKAFEPILANFRDAKGEASAFTKRLQDIAGIGIRPLAQEFARLNMHAIQDGMEGIAYQINGIVYHTVRLLNTTRGQEAIKTIAEGTKKAFEGLSPHIIAFVDALIGLTARGGDKGIKAVADAIGAVLDKLTEWANNTSVQDIKDALSDLSGYGQKVKDVFEVVRDVGKWMGENQSTVKAFSDVVAAATITIGIATGNIPAILAGSAAILVNHWKGIKEQFGGFASDMSHIFDGSTVPAEITESFRAFAEQVGPAISEAIERITNTIRDNKSSFETLGHILAEYVIPLLSFLTLSVFQFVIDSIINTINVVGTLVKAWELLYNTLVPILTTIARMVLDFFGTIVNGAASAFGWIPNIGPRLQDAAKDFNNFASSVNAALDRIDPSKDIYIRTHFVGGQGQSRGGEYRTGGIIGGMSAAATGGIRQGLVKVGEGGEEFVRLPTGSMVYPNANTNQMQAMSNNSGGGTQRVLVDFAGNLDSAMAQWFMEAQRTGAVQIYATSIS